MVELFDSLSDWNRFAQSCEVFNCILQPTGEASDVISARFVSRLSSRSVLNLAIISCTVLDKFRPKSSEVVSGVVVDYVAMDVRVKFGDSTSNGSRLHVERTNMTTKSFAIAILMPSNLNLCRSGP